MKTKFRLKILTKLVLGFGIILLSFLTAYVIIYQILTENKELTKKVNDDIVPSMSTLTKLSSTVFESKHLLKNWVIFEKRSNTPKKLRLLKINQITYIETKYELKNLSQNWEKSEQQRLNQIFDLADSWFSQQKDIMKRLNSPDKYNDPEFDKNFLHFVQEGEPLMDLADDIKSQIEEMHNNKKDILLSYNEEMERSFLTFSNRIIISGIILIIMVLLIAFLFVNSMLIPLNSIRKIISLMSEGELPKKEVFTSSDEIGQMGKALNNLIFGLKQKAEFAKEIETGNFEGQFKISGKQDILGNSLLSMRNSLAEAVKHEVIRGKENEERSWISQGITEFNEIIREHSGTKEEFALVAINKLTRYTNSQVGGLYVLNDINEKDIFLELIAFYAYDRHKFFEQKILPGENLIGQCYIEKDTIFLTDIPKGYIRISSGLGNEDAKSILIVPLIINEKVYGVVELASLNTYEPYNIEFVEKVSEILASTISTIQINLHTAQLLEETHEKSEILEQQEKESIKGIEQLNIELEELRVINKEIKQKNQQLENKLNSEE